MGCLPRAGGLLDQPAILMQQWQIVFAEEAAKAEYDEKTKSPPHADGQAPQGAQLPPNVTHERTIIGPGPM